MNSKFIIQFVFFITSIVCEDLYEVLGIEKTASTMEIKAAYKKLAREWHPDKNKDPEATDRFTKINEAYETLGDVEKRRDYDNFGYTTAQERPQHRKSDFGSFPFEDIFGHSFFGGASGFGSGFGQRAESIIDKYLTTLRKFETKLQPESHGTPCFIYAFGNFCFDCMRVEHIIEKLIHEVESVGLCIATIHVQRTPDLASQLRIHSVPLVMGMVKGRLTHLKSDVVDLHSLREFIRQLFPKETLTMIKDRDADTFLQSWRNNQVAAIFFSPRTEPSARLLSPAFSHRDRINFAYVCTSDNVAQDLMLRYNINKKRETLVMFNEETTAPIASLSMQQLPHSTLVEVISSNRYLLLPRLSSQSVFNELCPMEAKLKNRKLCVALVTNKVKEHDVAREKFRQFALAISNTLNLERLRFVYLYAEVQTKVMEALAKGNSTRTGLVLEVAIIWHQDSKRVSYEFLHQGWSLAEDDLDVSREALKKRLTELLERDHLLPYKAVMPDFYNEHALSLLTRMVYKFMDWGDRLWFFFAGYHPQTYVMTITLVVMFVVMSLVIKRLNDAEAEQVRSKLKPTLKQARPPSSTPDNKVIHLYELRFESFNNLVKEADTGLTVIVLVDGDSKPQLLHKFAEIMQPYTRYSALTFGFMQVEYYITWYQHLLEASLNFNRKLNGINIKNCIGTVLALNGYRKYYYIYHPRNAQRWLKRQNRIGHAMGFMDSDSESEEEANLPADGAESGDKLFVDEVLSGLALWMDRVFDGSVRKVRLDYWPEMSQ